MQSQPGATAAHSPRTNPLSIATLIAGFFLGYIAVILGVISLRQNWTRGLRGNVMSWVGIIVGAVGGAVGTFIAVALIRTIA